MSGDLSVKIVRVDPGADLPTYGTMGSAGLDVQTMVDITLQPGQSLRVPTGIALAIPPGYVGRLTPRSSISGKGVVILGTIDSDYRGEVLLNVTYAGHYPLTFTAKRGDRIAQLLILPFPTVLLTEVTSVESLGVTDRGHKGFGSTGA